MVMARKKREKEKDIIDQLLDNINFKGLTQNEVVGQDGLIKQLTGRILQRALEAEMTEHLGYEKNSNEGDNNGNSRNGHTEKTVLLENGKTTIEVPRDRNAAFERACNFICVKSPKSLIIGIYRKGDAFFGQLFFAEKYSSRLSYLIPNNQKEPRCFP
jgi:hypothetical protein